MASFRFFAEADASQPLNMDYETAIGVLRPATDWNNPSIVTIARRQITINWPDGTSTVYQVKGGIVTGMTLFEAGGSPRWTLADIGGSELTVERLQELATRPRLQDERVYVSGYLSGDDVIRGADDRGQTLIGGAGDDIVSGGIFDDILDGDHFTNAIGSSDTADYSNALSGVVISLIPNQDGHGTATGVQTGTDQLWNFENVRGSRSADTITGNAENNRIEAGRGNDTVVAHDGDDTVVAYNDDGNDDLDGGEGLLDVLDYSGITNAAEAGVDINLAEGTGRGAAGTDTIQGFEVVHGTQYDDRLTGDAGANHLYGGAGDDTVVAHSNDGNDYLDGGNGALDALDYSGIVNADEEGVYINLAKGTGRGAAGTDTIQGFEVVHGTQYDDRLTGDAGANHLYGEGGSDIFAGGAGADRFYIESAERSIIKDFTAKQNDKVVLDSDVFAGLAGEFLSLDKVQGSDAQLLFKQETGQLYYDANGSAAGGRTLIAYFENHEVRGFTLTKDNFDFF